MNEKPSRTLRKLPIMGVESVQSLAKRFRQASPVYSAKDESPRQPGKMPAPRTVRVAALYIDQEYQRHLRVASVRRIAKEFTWHRFGAITVAARRLTNGKSRLLVIDGQHRVVAAAYRGIKEVPAVVLPSTGKRHEASEFMTINTARRNLGWMDKYRAGLTAANPIYLKVAELAERYGFAVQMEPPHIDDRVLRCPETLVSMVATDVASAENTFAVLDIVAKPGEAITRDVCHAIFGLCASQPDKGECLLSPRFRKKLKRLSHDELLAAALHGVRFHQKRSRLSLASGVAALLNKNLRGKRLVDPTTGM